MTSHLSNSAPSPKHPTAGTHTARSSSSTFFRNGSSNTSLLSLSSLRTLLPQYTLFDDVQEQPSSTGPVRSFFRDRFRNASRSSFSTLPPQYTDTLGESPSLSPEVTTENPDSPSYASSSRNSSSGIEILSPSSLQPRRSMLIRRASIVDFEGDPQSPGFLYSYPIRPKNPWATLHLHTRDAAPGDSTPLQNQPRVPRVWSCDPFTGALQLDLESPQNIRQISITVRCHFVLQTAYH
jgi:hypothetical protein